MRKRAIEGRKILVWLLKLGLLRCSRGSKLALPLMERMHLVALIVFKLPFYVCRRFILARRSVLCLRERETIKASPALASHADNVSSRIENFKEDRDPWSWAHVDIFRKRDIRSSSRQRSNDNRWRRLIITPIMPRKNRENRMADNIFIGRS